VPSSISNFERHVPNTRGIRVVAAAMLIFASFVGSMEIRLAELGYHPTIVDSMERWIGERERASRLGKRALILIGASRFQLGLDMNTLRRETGLEPVQLAIDGSPFGPILAGLAADPRIRGTVLVDYYDSAIRSDRIDVPLRYQSEFEQRPKGKINQSPTTLVETTLANFLHENLRIYADGASPVTSLLDRILQGRAQNGSRAKQYLITLPDRSRLADYTLVNMPAFYHQRVSRELGIEPDANTSATTLAHEIATLHPEANTDFIRQAKAMREMVLSIRSRGGGVIFVTMPSSGMIREIEERRYPRKLFWDRFVEQVGAPALHSAYDPNFRGFSCPDGSHLDFRDKARFTTALVRALGLRVNHKAMP
jgi:hypothetical protein